MSDVNDLVHAIRGSSQPPGGSIVTGRPTPISFGARQAIIVRNNESRKALPMPEFENATILTVAECKGATYFPSRSFVRFPPHITSPHR